MQAATSPDCDYCLPGQEGEVVSVPVAMVASACDQTSTVTVEVLTYTFEASVTLCNNTEVGFDAWAKTAAGKRYRVACRTNCDDCCVTGMTSNDVANTPNATAVASDVELLCAAFGCGKTMADGICDEDCNVRECDFDFKDCDGLLDSDDGQALALVFTACRILSATKVVVLIFLPTQGQPTRPPQPSPRSL